MDEWIDQLADRMGEDRMSPREVGMVLKLARDVARGVERKLAPLSTYLAGVRAGRMAAEGSPREDALRRVVEASRGLLPERGDQDPP